jgi:hypothetical protein
MNFMVLAVYDIPFNWSELEHYNISSNGKHCVCTLVAGNK